MKILWAPWRMKYILEAQKGGSECFICEAYESSDMEEKLVLYKGDHTIVLMNKYPYNTGHLLVAPRRHVASYSELSREELCALNVVVKNSIRLLEEVLRPDGFNIGVNLGRVAGAGLEDHLHVHIVPRWNGDTNFMPVIAETKVIPESLGDTYSRLAKKASIIREDH